MAYKVKDPTKKFIVCANESRFTTRRGNWRYHLTEGMDVNLTDKSIGYVTEYAINQGWRSPRSLRMLSSHGDDVKVFEDKKEALIYIKELIVRDKLAADEMMKDILNQLNEVCSAIEQIEVLAE